MTPTTDEGAPTAPGLEQDTGLFRTLFEAAPDKMVALTPRDYQVVAVTNSYLTATYTTRAQLVGHRLFDVFQDNPEDPDPEGSRLLKESLYRVETLGVEDVMAPQSYPVRRHSPQGDYFEDRYWSVINVPVLDDQGKVRYIINRAEDITALMTGNEPVLGESDTGLETDLAERVKCASTKHHALELEVVLRNRELKDAYRRLHAQESSLRAAQRLLGLGLWRIHVDTGDVDISDSTRDLLGLAPDAPNPMEILLNDSQPPCGNAQERHEQFRAWLATQPQQMEFRRQIPLPDGSIRYLHGAGELIETTEGRVIMGVLQDITRQIELSANLSSAENLQRLAGSIAHLGGWRIDRRTSATRWSDELWNIYEVEPNHQIPLSEQIPPALRARLRDFYEECCRKAKPCDREFQFTTPKGNNRWIRVIAEPERDETGEVIIVHGAVQDVTQQKLQEQLLQQRVKELRCLYQTSLVLSQPDRDVGQLLGELADTIPPAMLYHEHAVARLCFEAQEFRSQNWQEPLIAARADILHNNQPAGWIEAGYTQTYHDDPPEPVLFAEEEREMLSAIARQIGQVLETREGAKRLAQAQRMEAVGQLTGGVAHDFNNLLTVILGNAELLSHSLQNYPELARLADMTTRAADRGAQLTNRLLAFARRQALEPRPVAVDQLVGEIEPLLGRTLTGNIDIETRCGDGLWPAEVDPVQLETALLNLVLNARDSMPDGGKLLIEVNNTRLDHSCAHLPEELKPGEYVMLAVTDTGSGMSQDVRNRAFEPFFTTKHMGEGSGLGLSMVYGFVRQSGGQVRIYSEPGEGTTVRLYLPRTETPVAASEWRPDGDAPSGDREHILVVEDDDLVRNHVLGVLQSLGYRTSSASSGPEALQRLQGLQDVDLLFTDIVMPGGLNGQEVAKAALTVRPGLKVLYTSGYTENALVHHGRVDASVVLLSKPYRSQELAQKVRQALDS